jgi:hypothetical protein
MAEELLPEQITSKLRSYIFGELSVLTGQGICVEREGDRGIKNAKTGKECFTADTSPRFLGFIHSIMLFNLVLLSKLSFLSA